MGIKNYTELKVWQKSMDFVEAIYKQTEKFPKKEQYRLVDQLCRASSSIPSNIAEGSSRRSTKEFIRFINISYGSLSETETQIIMSHRLGYIDKKTMDELLALSSEIGRMLNALQNSLLKKLDNNKITELRTQDSVP